MNRVPVSSSNLASIGYDKSKKVLEIEFLNGGIYQYSDVAASVHDGLMAASSHGSYFDRHVKKANYPFIKLS